MEPDVSAAVPHAATASIVAGRANGTWQYARGSYVYALRRDPDREEMLVHRYRLQLNR